MFEIIIFFVVISVISNIIKAVGKQRPAQMGETGGEAFSEPKEIPLPGNRMERVSPKYTVKIQNPAPKASTPPQDRTQSIPQQKIQPRNLPQASSQPKVRLSNLTPSRLVEGIILSEILAPPKSRR